MNQSVSIQRLTDHITRIETEITAIRRELNALPIQQSSQPSIENEYALVNKTTLKDQMSQLFQTLSIQGKPAGAESLQRQMREAELTPNELSQSIISAREE
jgi:hypothetical protein